MVLTPLVIGIGLMIGLLRGGRIDAITRTRVALWPALAAGIVLQTAGETFPLPGRAVVVTLGLICLVAVAMRNVHIPGAAVAGIGVTLNLAVLVANGHVPVRFEALTAFGQNIALSPTGLWELQTETTSLAFLGDIVPIPVLEIPVSFGDLIMLAGLMVIATNIVLQGRAVGIGVDELLADETAGPVAAGAATAMTALDPFDSVEPWANDGPAVAPVLIGTTASDPIDVAPIDLEPFEIAPFEGVTVVDLTTSVDPDVSIDLRAPVVDEPANGDVRRALFDDIPDLADDPLDWAESSDRLTPRPD